MDLIDYKKLKKEFDGIARPMYFFHDDADGLCSFLLVYHYVHEGVGVPIKAEPCVNEKFVGKVKYYQPDKVFVLDVPRMTQEFVDEAKVPIVWVDHHLPTKLRKVRLYNPRVADPGIYIPVTYLCWKTLGGPDWLMMVGAVGDHYLPPEAVAFSKENPSLLSEEEAKDIEKAKHDSNLAKLVKVFGFILKAPVSEVKRTVKVLTRVKVPEEILKQSTPAGKFVWKQYQRMNKYFLPLWRSASKTKPKGNLLVYTYSADKYTFAAEIAGRLLYKHRDKLVIVAREVADEVRGSVRSYNWNLREVLPKAISGLEGSCGGHEGASGVVVKQKDWKQFLENLNGLLK